jgi:hypothetical protein
LEAGQAEDNKLDPVLYWSVATNDSAKATLLSVSSAEPPYCLAVDLMADLLLGLMADLKVDLTAEIGSMVRQEVAARSTSHRQRQLIELKVTDELRLRRLR